MQVTGLAKLIQPILISLGQFFPLSGGDRADRYNVSVELHGHEFLEELHDLRPGENAVFHLAGN